MTPLVLKRHPVTRFVHYLYLLPFFPALRPLLVNFTIQDTSVYLGGIVLVTFLVIYGNKSPLVRVESDRLLLYLHYRHNAESHPFNGIRSCKRRSANRLTLDSKGFKPVSIRLKRTDADRLAARLKEEGIHVE